MIRHCLRLLLKPRNHFCLTSRLSSNFHSINIDGQLPQKIVFGLPLLNKIEKEVSLPAAKYPCKSIYNEIPLLNVNLPCLNNFDKNISEVKLPAAHEREIKCKGGILKIRRKKMNKHKLKKRRKRDRAQIRKVLIGRERNRRKLRAWRKGKLIKKIETLTEANPKSTYAERPYVIHRLEKW